MGYREFVLAWLDARNKGSGVQGVADKCNLTVSRASAKANYLRKRGVKLPHMLRAKSTAMSIDALNQLIESKI